MIFPQDFKNYKIIKTFTKPRAIDDRAFVTNDPYGWFIDVLYYKKRSGIVKGTETIIAKDMDGWTNWLKNLGWNENKV